MAPGQGQVGCLLLVGVPDILVVAAGTGTFVVGTKDGLENLETRVAGAQVAGVHFELREFG